MLPVGIHSTFSSSQGLRRVCLFAVCVRSQRSLSKILTQSIFLQPSQKKKNCVHSTVRIESCTLKWGVKTCHILKASQPAAALQPLISAQCITTSSCQPATYCHTLFLLYFPLSAPALVPLSLHLLYSSFTHLRPPPDVVCAAGLSVCFWVHVHLDLVCLIALWCMLIEGTWEQMSQQTELIAACQTPYSLL